MKLLNFEGKFHFLLNETLFCQILVSYVIVIVWCRVQYSKKKTKKNSENILHIARRLHVIISLSYGIFCTGWSKASTLPPLQAKWCAPGLNRCLFLTKYILSLTILFFWPLKSIYSKIFFTGHQVWHHRRRTDYDQK